MSEKPDEKIVVNRTLHWPSEISAIAGPRLSGDTRESWLARAARKSGVAFWHIKSLYYGQLTDPKFSVAFKVLSAAQKAQVEAARIDAASLAERFENIAGGMLNADKDFYGPDATALINAARLLRTMAGPGNDGGVK